MLVVFVTVLFVVVVTGSSVVISFVVCFADVVWGVAVDAVVLTRFGVVSKGFDAVVVVVVLGLDVAVVVVIGDFVRLLVATGAVVPKISGSPVLASSGSTKGSTVVVGIFDCIAKIIGSPMKRIAADIVFDIAIFF